MHIPDGYLSPATSAAMYAVSLPFWYLAVSRAKRALNHRTVPVLALFAAFSFVIQMFNIPLPGGTTDHAVGGTLVAIVAGPWAAVVGLSVVLGIQALFFGDGGLMTLGANSFNLAIVLPLAGYFTYRVVSGSSGPASSRRLLGAAIGSFASMVVASLLTALELGMQPVLFHAADGTPLYAPYGLAIALPAMLVGHLAVAGPAEALVTGLVFSYLQRSRSSLVAATTGGMGVGRLWPLWAVVAILALATPLGLLASGTAWGEWGTDELNRIGLGFVPQGLAQIEGWWRAPLPGYGLPRMGTVIGYLLSAGLGVTLIAFLFWVLRRFLGRRLAARRATPEKDRRPRGESFLCRSISSFARALEAGIAAEDCSRAPGLLQGIDPRVKVGTFALFIVVAALARSFSILLAICGLLVALALLSKLSPGFFARRILLFLPFTAVIALPALFVTPGKPLVHLVANVALTEQGARAGGFLALRVMDSVAAGSLLILTTPWPLFLAALRWFRVPPLFVDVLGMTYRYIFLLLHSVNSMFLARRSRILGSLPGGEERRWLGRAIAATLAKSQHLGEEVYLAMLSRGYCGEAVVISGLRARRRDLAWAGFAVCAASLLLWRNP